MTDKASKRGITLIELLAVIVIIVVLMGLLPPPSIGLSVQARKVMAKNDMTQAVNGIKAFYTEYGRYPIDPVKVSGSNVSAYGDSSLAGYLEDNSVVIDVLRNNTASPTHGALVAMLNPRQIVFLECPIVKNNASPRSGVHSVTGIWYDPYGTSYNLAIHPARAGQISKATHGYTDADFGVLKTGVIAWSYGKDKKAGTGGNHIYADSDDIVSWQ